jgi:hypothetical protein
MKTKKIIFIALFIVISVGALAQEKLLKSADEARALSAKVTELFKANKITDAFKELRLYWPIPENEVYGMEEKTIKSLNMVEGRFGKPESILKVNESAIKDIGIRETYFVKYQFTAIRVIFTYYRNEKGWLINSFKWDDSFTEEFK